MPEYRMSLCQLPTEVLGIIAGKDGKAAKLLWIYLDDANKHAVTAVMTGRFGEWIISALAEPRLSWDDNTYLHGKLHSAYDNPAVAAPHRREWYRAGLFHRDVGPALAINWTEVCTEGRHLHIGGSRKGMNIKLTHGAVVVPVHRGVVVAGVPWQCGKLTVVCDPGCTIDYTYLGAQVTIAGSWKVYNRGCECVVRADRSGNPQWVIPRYNVDKT